MRRADRGTMTMELAILAPLLIAFFLLMVGVGRVVEAQGQVDGAARDAARAASVGRDRSGADSAAKDAATATLSGKDWCKGGPRTRVDFADWRRGGQVTATVTCDIDLTGLSLIGFAPTKTTKGRAVAPLDTLRRIQDPVGPPGPGE